MLESDTIRTVTEMLKTSDGCNLFLRSWVTNSKDVLLILHGLGAHSGWFIDMGNKLATRGMNVYVMDHRGFGGSGGLPGQIDDYHTYVADIDFIVTEIRTRHPEAAIHLLGHSMGGIFASHYAAKYENLLASVLFLNPWIQDTSQTPLLTTLAILLGGLFKSHRYWQVAGGTEVMTTNPETIQTLNADTYWCRKQTASFLFQIFPIRLPTLKMAKLTTKTALLIQPESHTSVNHQASRLLHNTYP